LVLYVANLASELIQPVRANRKEYFEGVV
ncbi:hypothetical protein LCGC14_2671670, partial [marine sediment metagenome]